MQPRLNRSRTDKMMAGVCGGLGEYFSIDPIIVRLIFVLVTLTSGVGLPVYILLWVLMPRKSLPPQASPPPQMPPHDQGHRTVMVSQPTPQAYQQQQATHTANPGGYDPQTGAPIPTGYASTGKTIKLEFDPQTQAHASAHYTTPYPTATQAPAVGPKQPAASGAVQRRQQGWRRLGFIMIGLGGLILLNKIGISMGIIIPVVMIILGIRLLRRSR